MVIYPLLVVPRLALELVLKPSDDAALALAAAPLPEPEPKSGPNPEFFAQYGQFRPIPDSPVYALNS